MNTLYLGDCLNVLRDNIPDESVDLVYIDPPFIRAAFQVKGGQHIQSKDIDALLGAMEKHKCELGVFLTIAEPTKPMLDTIAGSGFVEIPGYKIPKLQILTLKDYFKNKTPKLPKINITFKAAQLKGKKKQNQMDLGV
jgi:site-specific DNA-methyltransferase (adenine-specific)